MEQLEQALQKALLDMLNDRRDTQEAAALSAALIIRQMCELAAEGTKYV